MMVGQSYQQKIDQKVIHNLKAWPEDVKMFIKSIEKEKKKKGNEKNEQKYM